LSRADARPQNISEQPHYSIAQHTRNAAADDDLTLFIDHRQLDPPAR
jgi:hypothetical protein